MFNTSNSHEFHTHQQKAWKMKKPNRMLRLKIRFSRKFALLLVKGRSVRLGLTKGLQSHFPSFGADVPTRSEIQSPQIKKTSMINPISQRAIGGGSQLHLKLRFATQRQSLHPTKKGLYCLNSCFGKRGLSVGIRFRVASHRRSVLGSGSRHRSSK